MADSGRGQGEEFLVVNVTRSCHGITDMSPFKVVTKVRLKLHPLGSARMQSRDSVWIDLLPFVSSFIVESFPKIKNIL